MRFRNLFSWASASGTWLLPQTKNIFCRPTACRTTSPSSTWQISRSPRRSRSASFLGVSQFHGSDSFGLRFTPVGETTTLCFPHGSQLGDGLSRVLDRKARARHGGGCESVTHGRAWCDVHLATAAEPDAGIMQEMTTVDPLAVAIEGVSHCYRRQQALDDVTLHYAIDVRRSARPQRGWKEYFNVANYAPLRHPARSYPGFRPRCRTCVERGFAHGRRRYHAALLGCGGRRLHGSVHGRREHRVRSCARISCASRRAWRRYMRGRSLAMAAAIGLALQGTSLPADPRFPDWPCNQIKVPEISVAAVWAGPGTRVSSRSAARR